jgi:hypothetical protein
MADAGGSQLNIGAPVEKRGRGRPRSSKNKATVEAVVASSSAPVKRRPGRPAGSKNKPKVPSAAPGPSTPFANASPPSPRIYYFFCIAGAQCREIQRLPLKYTKFMDGENCGKRFFVNNLGEELPMKWRSGTMAPVSSTSRAAGDTSQMYL